MIKKVFLAALGVIFLGAFAATPVYAEGEDTKPAIWLQISPVSERVVLEPGKSLLASMCSSHPFQDPCKCFLASTNAQETY